MKFLHDHPGFGELVARTSREAGVSGPMAEKDYWITHTLWSVQDAGFGVHFKGGTSLSKAYGVIRRFSEDLDVKLDPGRVEGVPSVTDWVRESRLAVQRRREYFEILAARLRVPGAEVALDPDRVDAAWRSADLIVRYPRLGPAAGAHVVTPNVRLEIGSGVVEPALPRDITSWVHEHAWRIGAVEGLVDNRPRDLSCVHPLVTLIEKVDAVQRRFERADLPAGSFVRHYEDAAAIVSVLSDLPALPGSASAASLARGMLEQRQIRALPSASHEALALRTGPRTAELREAYEVLAGLFFGERRSLDEACAVIRAWIGTAFP